MKATLRDVAKAAGVGISTASYVLNGTGLHKVGAETQQRIREAAAFLNYTPNAIARGLRSGKSYLVGVMVPAIDYSFMPGIISGIDHELSLNKYNMLLCTYNNIDELQEKLSMMCQKQIDGIILKTWQPATMEVIDIVKPVNLPCVMVANPNVQDFPGVWVDPVSIAGTAFDHLYKNNHRRIIVCCPNQDCGWLGEFRKLLAKHNLAENIVYHDGNCNWHDELFALTGKDSVVIADDLSIYSLLYEAHLREIKIPEELSVLAIDCKNNGQFTIPPLDNVAQPHSSQGQNAAKMLLQWINSGNKPQNVILQSRLMVRNSVKTL